MITAITIENFKGIRERVRIPVKPITLVFGANSAGKSTILQALHYAREVLVRRNLDCDNTISGGRFVDLGGFRHFVHGRDPRRRVTLGFELLIGKHPLPPYHGLRGKYNSHEEMKSITWPIQAQVEFSVAYSASGLYVSDYSVRFAGERFATITSSPGTRPPDCQRLELNFEHPIFQMLGPMIWKLDAELENEGERHQLNKVRSGEAHLFLGQRDALPDPQDREGNAFELWFSERGGMVHGDVFQIGYEFLDQVLAQLIAGPCAILADELRAFRYLGPLRDTPSREYSPPRFPDASRWIAGLGAWDLLNDPSPEFLATVSEWLSSSDRLDTGYALQAKRTKELDPESPLWTELRQGRAAKDPDLREKQLLDLPTRTRVSLVKESGEGETRPQDVGVGVAQVLPVVVACCDPQPSLVAIEQPELHLHPRAQCALGDLLISGALGHWHEVESPEIFLEENGPSTPAGEQVRLPRSLLIETHSEHLILRILRRIRETTSGQPHDGIPIAPDDLAVIYVAQEDGQSVPSTLRVNAEGEFVDQWPHGFFDERGKELFG